MCFSDTSSSRIVHTSCAVCIGCMYPQKMTSDIFCKCKSLPWTHLATLYASRSASAKLFCQVNNFCRSTKFQALNLKPFVRSSPDPRHTARNKGRRPNPTSPTWNQIESVLIQRACRGSFCHLFICLDDKFICSVNYTLLFV